MGIWTTNTTLVTERSIEQDAEAIAHARHVAVLEISSYAHLVGLFHSHYPDAELPETLRKADAAAFDASCAIIRSAADGYDVVAITAESYRSGVNHVDGECAFCDETIEVDEAAQAAVEGVRSLITAI